MSLSLAAAPSGARIGLSAARSEGEQVYVMVAPKAWRPPGPRDYLFDPNALSSLSEVRLFETERLHLRDESENTSRLFWGVLGASRQRQGGNPSWDSSMLAPDIPSRGPLSSLVDRAHPADPTDLLRLFDRV